MTEAEAEAAAPSAAALAAGAPPGPVATDLAGAYAALDLAEEEYVAGEAPAKVEVVQRIRRRCMGTVLMAEALAYHSPGSEGDFSDTAAELMIELVSHESVCAQVWCKCVAIVVKV